MDVDISQAYRLSNGIELPAFDPREAAAFTLPSGLKCLVLSDPHTESAACSVEIGVGHFSDPAELPGLAHFTEHMAFMGTRDFPDENSFSSFLSEHGGYSNAYTACEATNYHFEVQADSLREALQRFSGFFTCPLLTASAAARELDAVDSEHHKNLQQDMWRSYQLDKATSDPAHVYSKFGTGSKATLSPPGVDVRGALLAFHAAHYSAGRATLALVGAEPVATLEAWVRELFGAFANNGSPEPAFPPLPAAPLLIRRVPVKDSRRLEVSWTLPPQRAAWRSQPCAYLAHLLGHEGPGSLLSALMARGWATGLSAGAGAGESCFAKFEVDIRLTPSGLAAYSGVLQLMQAYLGMLEAHGPQKWVWEEDAAVRVAKVRYSSKGQPMDTATAAASALALAPPHAAFTKDRLVREWAPEAVAAVIAACAPGNPKVTLVSQDAALAAAATCREPVYGTPYSAEALPGELVAAMAAARALGRGVAEARLAALRAASGGGGGAVQGAAGCVTGGPAALGSEAAAAAAAAALAAAVADGMLPTTGPALADAAAFPPLTLPAPNPFLPSDFTLAHAGAAARRAAEAAGQPAPEPSPFSATLMAPPATLVHLAAGAGAGAGAGAEGGAAGGAGTSASALPLGAVRVRREPAPVRLRPPPPSLAAGPGRALWWHCDSHFAQPKATAIASLTLPAAVLTPRGTALLDMYAVLAMEALREVGYAASLAGLAYDVSVMASGALRVYCGGFSQRLPVLLARVAAALAAPHFTDAQYAMHKEERLRAYANSAKDSPVSAAVRGTAQALVAPSWNRLAEVLPEARALGPEDLRRELPALLGGVTGALLVAGSVGEAGAVACGEALWGPLLRAGAGAGVGGAGGAAPCAPLAAAAAPRAARLPPPLHLAGGRRVVFELARRQAALNPEDPNAAVEVTLQLGAVMGSAKRSALALLCSHLLKEPFFDDLRTKQTLGYIVQSTLRLDAGVSSLSFRVQSTKVECEELLERVEAFLAGFAEHLAALTPEKFHANALACAVEAGAADKNLEGEAWRLWGEVSEAGLGRFTRASGDAAALLALTQGELVAFYREHCAPGGGARRVFASMVARGTVAAVAEGGQAAGQGEGEGEEGEEGEGEGEGEGEAAPPAAGEAQTLISAPLPGVAFAVPLEAVAAVLAALPAAASAAPPAAADVAAEFRSAGLADVAQELESGTHAVVRLRVACSGREAVRQFLPLFPDFAALGERK